MKCKRVCDLVLSNWKLVCDWSKMISAKKVFGLRLRSTGSSGLYIKFLKLTKLNKTQIENRSQIFYLNKTTPNQMNPRRRFKMTRKYMPVGSCRIDSTSLYSNLYSIVTLSPFLWVLGLLLIDRSFCWCWIWII